MLLRTLIAACVLFWCNMAVHAQSGGPTAQDFAVKAIASNKFMIQLSRRALEASSNDKLKAFAEESIKDRRKSTKKLVEIIRSEGIKLKGVVDDKQKALLDSVANATGEEFDRVYLSEQVKAHQDAVAIFSAYAQSGDRPSLKAFAAETLPSLEKNQKKVRQIVPGAS